jgi:hypothetical protein
MALPKTTRKKKVRAAPRRRGGKLTGPSFDNWENMDPVSFGKLQRSAADFYYQEYKPADIIPYFFTWMKENGYNAKQIAAAKKGNPRPTAGIYSRILLDGCPDYNEKYAEYWTSLPGTGDVLNPHSHYLHKWAAEAIEIGEKVVEEKKAEEKEKANVYVPTIQERIRDQSQDMVEEIDEWLEGWIIDPNTFDPKGFDFKKHFNKLQPSQAHARKMKGFYETILADYDELERMPTAGQLKKMGEHEQDLWQQLKEGYAHVKKADIKKLRTAIEELRAALDFIIDSAKATRKPRKAKPKSATKLVEKLKYLKTDEKFKLASISPDQIIGASELWVFNVKTRKLGKYVATNIDPTGMGRDGSGLQVKGTTIIGFDENLSVQKTLRKPEEQLRAFKAAGKVALRKFLDEINTTDTKLNGRCNPDTVLLKIS